jgi:hypothetical protein
MFTSFNGSARMARFGSGSVVLRARGDVALEEGQIIKAAPSIGAQGKHESRSEKYTYIPTIDVLRGLIKEGFQPVEVRQGGSRDELKRGFTKHMIRMRHAGDSVSRLSMVGDSVREIVLLNSHDGTSSYQLMNGLYRLVCLNGLITCEGGEMQRVAHKGDIIGQVIEGAYTVLSQGDATRERVKEMQSLQLSNGEQEAFASAALELRFNDKDEEGKRKAAPIEPRQLLGVRRHEDAGNDMWKTFNRVQENIIQGGNGYVHRAADGQRSRRHTRPVNSIDGNVSINRALWVLASKMQELKEGYAQAA